MSADERCGARALDARALDARAPACSAPGTTRRTVEGVDLALCAAHAAHFDAAGALEAPLARAPEREEPEPPAPQTRRTGEPPPPDEDDAAARALRDSHERGGT